MRVVGLPVTKEVDPASPKPRSARARYLMLAVFLGLTTSLKLLPRFIPPPPLSLTREQKAELAAAHTAVDQHFRELDRLTRSEPLEHWLTSLETELLRCEPDLLRGARLRPPADSAGIAQLAAVLGYEIPPELTVLLRWHDGQDGETSVVLCEGVGLRLLGVEEIRAAVTRVRAGSPHANAQLVPFLANRSGDIVLAIDTRKPRSVCRLAVNDNLPATEIDCYEDTLQELFGRCALAAASSCDGGTAQ